MPRAYTQSGQKGVYEPNEWKTPTWSGSTGSITGPDSNGNYTVNPPSGYRITTDTSQDYCETEYHNVKHKIYMVKETITINVIGQIAISGGTAYYAWAKSNLAVPCDVNVRILYTKIKSSGASDDLSINLTINKGGAETTKLNIGKTTEIRQIIINSVTGSPTTFGYAYAFNYSKA